MLEILSYFTARGKIREGAGGQGDWHDGYLATDVLALADGMESMREAWHRDLGLDLLHSMTLPSATYQAMLKGTGASIEHITDAVGGRDFMDAINSNIRGGASVQFQPDAEANNPRVKGAERGVLGDSRAK